MGADPDDHGGYSLWTTEMPPGTYTVRPAVVGRLGPSSTTSTVAAGDATPVHLDPGSQPITAVSVAAASRSGGDRSFLGPWTVDGV